MLFVACQRDAFHVDAEGVAYPIIITVFLREVVVKPCLKFSKMRTPFFLVLGNMSSLSLDT